MRRRRQAVLGGEPIRIPTGTIILFCSWIGIGVGFLLGTAALRKIRKP